MTVLVFLHGIFGSRLGVPGQAEEIWPPTPSEMLSKRYPASKAQDLLRDDLEVRGVIDKVSCCDVYGSLIKDFQAIGYQVNGADRALIVHAYDWRRDLRQLSEALADRLDQDLPEGRELIFVAHSMGGLIVRHLLESGRYTTRRWFDQIRDLVTLATPHQGAPLALQRAVGLSGSMALSPQQTAQLSAHPSYPSAYQLLPPPGALYVRDILNGEAGADHVEVHDPAFAAQFRLATDNLKANAEFYAALGDRPDHVRYFYFASAQKETVVRYTKIGGVLEAVLDRGGDDTVPVASAASMSVPTSYVPGKHSDLFKTKRLRERLYALLGAPDGVRPVSATGDVVGAALVEDIIAPDDPVTAGGVFEVIINFKDPMEQFDDQLRLTVNAAVTLPDGLHPADKSYDLSYQGPPLESLVLELTAPPNPGFYELSFAEAASDDPTPPVLIVSPS
jgi:pimeloyl-ACP methyl ester carboxylesterase